jgi:hypothetical protein
MFIGAVIGNLINPVQERLYRLYSKRIPAIPRLVRLSSVEKAGTDANSIFNPEARLYTACLLSVFMSIGLFMWEKILPYGHSSEH